MALNDRPADGDQLPRGSASVTVGQAVRATDGATVRPQTVAHALGDDARGHSMAALRVHAPPRITGRYTARARVAAHKYRRPPARPVILVLGERRDL